MFGNDRFRPLRGAFGNALVWGIGWGAAGFAVLAVMIATGVAAPGIGLLDAFGMAVRIGIMGAIAGFVFAIVIWLAYRGRRLADISWWKFGIAGGVAAGLFVPLFMESLSLLTGGGLVPWGLIDTDVLIATVFGAIVAGGSLKLAQRVESLGTGIEYEQLDGVDTADVTAAPSTPRELSPRREQ